MCTHDHFADEQTYACIIAVSEQPQLAAALEVLILLCVYQAYKLNKVCTISTESWPVGSLF